MCSINRSQYTQGRTFFFFVSMKYFLGINVIVIAVLYLAMVAMGFNQKSKNKGT